jgi:multidrug efflux pump subunit AcrB
MNSLKGVFETLIIAILLAMAILFLFFGNVKASLIVGTVPSRSRFSWRLVCMSAMGFSTNLISVGSLVLGVGMVVDNSIVVLDSCFRAKEEGSKKHGTTFYDAALEGAGIVLSAIAGSTITTCVVFLPLALLQGLSGQLFKQFGFMIVFCMLASLFSACTIVPLMYYYLHPVERESPVSRFMHAFQEAYKRAVARILPHGVLITVGVIAMLAGSCFLATKLGMELMPSIDGGIVNVSVTMKPGLKAEAADEIIKKAEKIVADDPDVKDYLLTYGNSGVTMMSAGGTGGSITAYLKSTRKDARQKPPIRWYRWKKAFALIPDCTITAETSSESGMSMLSTNTVEVDLEGTNLDTVKKTADDLVEKLHQEPYVTKVHSSMENAAPLLKVKVDPVKAQAEGLTPAGIGSSLYMAMSGKEVSTFTVDGKDYSVRIEYPDGSFNSVDRIRSHLLTTASGTEIPLSDIADVEFEDSPSTIVKSNKKYQVSIKAEPVEQYKKTADRSMKDFVKNADLPAGVETADNAMDSMMKDEIGALAGALGTAIFLIFIVMAMQFESPKFSIMVMTTIPFSLIGAFTALFLARCKINMVSMIGFLMMVGTVVNNGILYVDTVNQLRVDMDLDTALAEAGAIRLRPILMTTLTTIIAMVPLCMAIGESGQLLQGLALVNVGGLTASTILALLVLPVFYKGMDNIGKKKKNAVPADVD